MPFDDKTRNRLARFVTDARELIKSEFTEQLQRVYGISATGDITSLADLRDLDEEQRGLAELLRERVDYLKASSLTEENPTTAAVDRLAREQAFTVLNRLAAIRMAEKRGFIVESVGHGYQSKGFQVYCQVAGSGLGDVYHRYRRYLFCLFDELALDLGALFDRRSPTSLLFPREGALGKLFELINDPDIAVLWVEDETIGWIYQYYNDEVERRSMREKSAAPRDSRELAVRNQFFTPRYVVEFLVDNTLGRIWYEMRHGDTSLRDRCHYLVRRPNEVFLAPGQDPSPKQKTDGFNQEEMLKLPVYVPHRPIKDPRDIRLLDPACGSMHFGIYAFDLFEVIYQEAWELSKKGELKPPALHEPLHEMYSTKESFLRDIPKLIIENNIHGVDIDPRAVQIAALSLWLRAQKSWKEQSLSLQDRRITRSQIVCAEAMPGNSELLREFSQSLHPPILGQFLTQIVEKMQLAGEAGPLLKIEDNIAELVREAKSQWQRGPVAEQALLFADNGKSTQESFRFDQTGVTDEQFWQTAERRIYETLHIYSERAEAKYSQRLFADDAERGFAFIDLCRKRYDVVLMNPPFGAGAKASKDYVDEHYPTCSNDVFAAFVERGLEISTPGSCVGAITSRTGLFLETFGEWRKSALFGRNSVLTLLDLGYGVLDAMVETAAYVIEKERPPGISTCIRGLRFTDKGPQTLKAIDALQGGAWTSEIYTVDQTDFERLPLCSLPYWLPEELLSVYCSKPSFIAKGGSAKKGLTTGDNFRFVRTTWEIDSGQLAATREDTNGLSRWVFFPKGGEYSPFYDDIHLVVNWWKDGLEMRAFSDDKGNPLAYPRSERLYFDPGLTYPYRTTSGFNLRPLPRGCIFSDGGQAVFFCLAENSPAVARDYLLVVLGYFATRYARLFLEVALGEGDAVTSGSAARNYVTAAIESVPMFAQNANVDTISRSVAECVRLQMENFAYDETSRTFVLPRLNEFHELREGFKALKRGYLERCCTILEVATAVEKEFAKEFIFTDAGQHVLDQECGKLLTEYAEIDDSQAEVLRLTSLSVEALIQEALSIVGPGRYVVKKMYLSERRLELISHIVKRSPRSILKYVSTVGDGEMVEAVSNIPSWLLGCAFGRWDIRYATGENQVPTFPDPFALLPACPPGMLQNKNCMPLTRDDLHELQSSGGLAYDLTIPWDGILVDDQGHSLDLELHIQKTIEKIWGDRAEAIEQEMCTILAVHSLREFFRKPSRFFAEHLSRYSKSRRQAPIYWPLSTRSGSYTLWLYYPRLTAQTLHTCLADFLDPKLKNVSDEVQTIRGSNGSQVRLDELMDFEDELKEMRAEIEKVIKFPYEPNLNDGVLIAASPFLKLFRLAKWQKELKTCWQKLERGDFDWAHLAYSIWPDRVRSKCKTDRSIAIAHGLERLCATEDTKIRPKKRRQKEATLVEEDTV